MTPGPRLTPSRHPRLSRMLGHHVLACLALACSALACTLVLPVRAPAQQSNDQAPPMAMGSGRGVRGTVTAVTPDHLTLKTEAGEVFQVAITPNTQVRRGREPMKFADVHPGDGVGAMGELDAPNKTVHAMFLVVIDAEQIKKAREAMGKTYIAGKVTAIDELKISVLRSDGVSQTIQVDEGTSFKRGGRGMSSMMNGTGIMNGSDFGGGQGGQGGGQGGARSGGRANPGSPAGESITLADIKVGDSVAGPGALHSGVFIPTELLVADPSAPGRRRRQATGDPASAPASSPNPAEPK